LLSRLVQLYESVGATDLVQIAILAVGVFACLRFLSRTGAGLSIGRGLGLIAVGLFLAAQVVIANLDLAELGAVLDYLLATALVALVIIFQPELRRGLMRLGQTKLWRGWRPARHSVADPLADAAEALSRDCIGALIAIQREASLAAYVETGVPLDAQLSAALIRTLFMPRAPLHDGAVVIVRGRVVAAGCQLPMRAPERLLGQSGAPAGMRHRAALCLSEDTDAIVLVVSEETGRVSIAFGGRFEPVPRENLARRLVDLLHAPKPVRTAA